MSVEEIELLEQVKELVQECVRMAALEVSCQYREEGGVIQIELSGEDSGLLLRDNARLLYSLNHLLNQIFYRRTGGHYNIVLDSEDYRGTRVRELQLLARKAADKVRLSGKPFRLQAMPATERRVIHLALAEEPGVRTTSEGNGLHRRVVILPER